MFNTIKNKATTLSNCFISNKFCLCQQRELNPHSLNELDSKSSVSANSTMLAFLQILMEPTGFEPVIL